jgi:hypothetical protein
MTIDSDDKHEEQEQGDMPHLIYSDDETYIRSPTNEVRAKEQIHASRTYGLQCYWELLEKKYPELIRVLLTEKIDPEDTRTMLKNEDCFFCHQIYSFCHCFQFFAIPPYIFAIHTYVFATAYPTICCELG